MRHAQALAGSVLLLATTAGAPRALADAKSAVRADKLFVEGRAAAEKGDYETACVKLRESQKLDPAVGTAYNLGNCEEHLGRFTVALALFKSVVKKTKPDDPRNRIARARADDLDKRVPRLVITLPEGAPEGEKVTRDGVEIDDELGGVVPVDPGHHVIVIEAPGRRKRTVVVDLAEGEHRDLVATPGSDRKSNEATATPLAAVRTAGWISIGVGSAFLLVSAVAAGVTSSQKSTVDGHCPNMVCDPTGFDAVSTGQTLEKVELATLVLGAVGVGVGIGAVVLGSSGAPKDEKNADTALVPMVGPRGAGLTLVHRF